jgi:hypothetical protein
VKLNEFKKAKLNELDLSSFLGDYGSAAVRSGLGSLGGKNVLSSTDQMAKDDFIKKFNSRAASGLQSAIDGGLVDPNAAGQGMSTTQQGVQTNPVNAISQKRIGAQKQAQQRADAEGMPFSKLPTQATQDPAQVRLQKQQAAAKMAQQQMGQTPTPVAGRNVSPTPAQNRQEKLAAATQSAQGQMNPVSKLPADQFAKSATNVRQQQQGVATQNAQGQMNPVSKLPADQFNKSADNVRQQQQTTATQTAQQQMAEPTTKAPSTLDKPYDPATGKGRKYDGVTGEATPEWQKELDKQEAARLEKVEANRIASQADAAERDARNAELVRQGVRQNPSNVTNNITQTSTAPDNVKISTADPAEIQSKMQAKIDAMKEKNPKLAAAMQAEIDDQFKQDKPDNTVQMSKRNVNPRNAGKNAFGQMAQNLGKVAEGSRFDKLNYIFESILAEQDPAQGSTKQTISQYITNFFKQFMKGINISDPSVTTQVASLAKELEQNYAKDKGKTTLPKLANLGWSVSHAQAEENPQQATTTPVQPEKTEKINKTGGQGAAGTAGGGGGSGTTNIYNVFGQGAGSPQDAQKAKSAYQQIQSLLKGLTPANKQKILASLQKELANSPAKKTTPTTTPTGDTGGTYNKKTGAATLGGKNMVSAKDLPPNIQKQLPQAQAAGK